MTADTPTTQGPQDLITGPDRADDLERLLEQVDTVRAAWENSGEFTAQTLAWAGEIADRFTRRVHRQGLLEFTEVTAAHCRGFIDSATIAGSLPELTTRHARRTALRMLFRTLREQGVDVGDPTLDIRLPARSTASTRPLTDGEVTLCRASTRLGEAGAVSLHRATVWALAEATAMTSEITRIRVRDLDDHEHPHWVQLPGTRRADPRLGELSDWGTAIVARQLRVLTGAHAGSETLLVYRGRAIPGEEKAQSAACNAVAAVLNLAGLGDQPDVRPVSVRNWAGRRLYEAGMPIEQVARRLGCWSLDAAATAIGLTWRPS